jgi:demethylmenaquinone methyltransferase/2-methoxy-6-polyprenyl-1,4-benzoquinol methylase
MSREITRRATRQNYDRLSRWYDLFSSAEHSIARIGLQLLNVQAGEKVLEIGFGTGHALVDLANASGSLGNVCGIDLSPGMVVVAQRRIQRSDNAERITIQVGDATHLPYPVHHFHAAFMSFTLELFDSRMIPVVLAECQRILQPGGRLGIVSLDKKNTLAVEFYEWVHVRFPNIVDCSPIFVRPVLEKAGFVVSQIVAKKLWGLPVEAVVAQRP